MADSTTNLDLISSAQSQKEVTSNALSDAFSPASLFGRRASTCTALTWGYYGGRFNGTSVANGTLALTASATNYIVVNRATLVVSVSTTTTNWNNTATYGRAYSVVTGTATVTSYSDYRASTDGSGVLATPGIAVNAQSGTSYTFATTDRSTLVTFTNAAAIAATLPQAGTSFPAGWFMFVQNRGPSTVTITPTTSTVDGATSQAVASGGGLLIASDGTNYYTSRGRAPLIVVPVTYAATTTVDLTPYSAFATVVLDLTLTGNVTFNLINGTDGQVVKLRCRQDATGSRIWTSGANLRFGTDITSIVLSAAASKLDYIGFEWNATDSKADVLAITKGLS